MATPDQLSVSDAGTPAVTALSPVTVIAGGLEASSGDGSLVTQVERS